MSILVRNETSSNLRVLFLCVNGVLDWSKLGPCMTSSKTECLRKGLVLTKSQFESFRKAVPAKSVHPFRCHPAKRVFLSWYFHLSCSCTAGEIEEQWKTKEKMKCTVARWSWSVSYLFLSMNQIPSNFITHVLWLFFHLQDKNLKAASFSSSDAVDDDNL